MQKEIDKTQMEIDMSLRILEAKSTQDLQQLAEEFHDLVIEASPEEKALLSDQLGKKQKLELYDMLGIERHSGT